MRPADGFDQRMVGWCREGWEIDIGKMPLDRRRVLAQPWVCLGESGYESLELRLYRFKVSLGRYLKSKSTTQTSGIMAGLVVIWACHLPLSQHRP